MIFKLSSNNLQYYLKNIIDGSYNLYELHINTHENIKNIIYYIDKTKYNLNKFKKKLNNNEILAYIDVLWNTKNNTIYIKYVMSKKRKIGTFLLTMSFSEANRNNINNISLDDCSDFFQQTNNIYLKLGLKYVNDKYPEMYGNTSDFDINDLNPINDYIYAQKLTSDGKHQIIDINDEHNDFIYATIIS